MTFLHYRTSGQTGISITASASQQIRIVSKTVWGIPSPCNKDTETRPGNVMSIDMPCKPARQEIFAGTQGFGRWQASTCTVIVIVAQQWRLQFFHFEYPVLDN